jgi:DNA adenine methylase
MERHRLFLKWAGKYQILEHIMALLPSGHRPIEPFVDSGAVFINADYESYLLADSNEDLINLYLTLQREGESFIDHCRPFTGETNMSKRYWYELRRNRLNLGGKNEREEKDT